MSLFDSLRQDDVLTSLGLAQILRFIRLLPLLKNDIILAQPVYIPTTEAPLVLPPQITSFVADSIGIPEVAVDGCWNVLRDDVWEYPAP